MANLLTWHTLLSISILLLCAQVKVAETQDLSQPSPGSSGGGGCCSQLAAFGLTNKDLPVVVITSGGPIPDDKRKINATICTCSFGDAANEEYAGETEISVRGSSSVLYGKKSYKLKLQESAKFLGMPKDKDFILYGPELDKTLGMRNYLTYNLARESGRYASRTVYCEVYLVDDRARLGPQHYKGIYIGLERMERGKDRVDVAKLEPSDPSGGYIIQYDNDNHDSGDVTFGPLPGWVHPFVAKEPKEIPDGGAWLFKYLTDFEAALQQPDSSYASFIDLPAFIDYLLLTELTKNPDGYRGSTYMHKDKGQPLAMGPAWDYNEAYGLCCGYPIDGWQRGGASGPGVSGGSAISPNGWRFNICEDQERCLVHPGDGISRWYRQMWKDSSFQDAAAARWAQLRSGPWSNAKLETLVSAASSRIQGSAARNFAAFPEVLGAGADGEAAWRKAVDEMFGWLQQRVAWMDGAWESSSPAFIQAAGGQK